MVLGIGALGSSLVYILEFGHFEEQFPWVDPHPACGHPLPKGEGEIHALER